MSAEEGEDRVELADSAPARAAAQVVAGLRAAGHAAWWVGGCVRDLALGLPPKDYDVATSALPADVGQIFSHVVEVGVAFGVVRVRERPASGGNRVEIEVATFRADGGYSDGRHPDNVRFTDAREDVIRRDFTVNGLLLDPLGEDGGLARSGRIVDFVSGLDDLRAGVLRAIGDPDARFEEDALRLLRAVRFAARFGLTIEAATAAAISGRAATLTRVSAERIRDELGAMCGGPDPVGAVSLLGRFGLLEPLWPALARMDPGLRLASARFAAASAALAARPPPSRPQQGGLAMATTITLPLGFALIFADLVAPHAAAPIPLADLAAALRLSRADGRTLAHLVVVAHELAALAADPPTGPVSLFGGVPVAVVRLLRDGHGDAALVAALADPALTTRQREQLLAWRACRASVPASGWCPDLVVDGRALQALGRRPSPRFKLALLAAEDAQIAGEDPLAAALAALDLTLR